MCRAWLEHDRPCPRTYGAPGAATLDGDLVAFGHDGSPDFPLLCERMLMRRPGIVVTYKIFDLVTIDRRGLLRAPYCARLRRRLVSWFGPTSLAAVRPRDVAALVAGHEARRLGRPPRPRRPYSIFKSAKTAELVQTNPAEGAERPN